MMTMHLQPPTSRRKPTASTATVFVYPDAKVMIRSRRPRYDNRFSGDRTRRYAHASTASLLRLDAVIQRYSHLTDIGRDMVFFAALDLP